MNGNHDRRASEKLMQFFDTPKRCHVVGGVIAGVLIAATAWMSIQGKEIFRDRLHSPFKVTDSVRLISESKTLLAQHEIELGLSKRYESEIAEYKQWLPESIDWKVAKQKIKQLAEDSGAQVLAVDRKSIHSGSRVNVVSAKCEMHGTYAQICEFIHSLSDRSEPVWCDSIHLKRNESVSEVGKAMRCDATITLRLPFVGDQTAADSLFHGEISREI